MDFVNMSSRSTVNSGLNNPSGNSAKFTTAAWAIAPSLEWKGNDERPVLYWFKTTSLTLRINIDLVGLAIVAAPHKYACSNA